MLGSRRMRGPPSLREVRPMLKRCLAIGTLTMCAGLFSGGCADNESALFVRSVLHQISPACSPRAEPTADVVLGGILDMAFFADHHGAYVAALLVGNQLARVGNSDQVRT